MSPGRKKPTSRSGERVLRVVPDPEPCDCPECAAAEISTEDLVATLLAGGDELIETRDPIEAELFGADFLAVGELAGEGFDEALAGALIPAIAQLGTPQALAVLLALDSVFRGSAAAEAAERLLTAGVPAPAWWEELRSPMRLDVSRRFFDADGSLLVCTFTRAGRSHGFVLDVDHTDCDAAADAVLFPVEAYDEVLAGAAREGRPLRVADLDPGEFRWQAERALDARAVHDRESGGADLEDVDPEEPGYHLIAALLRAHLRTLPEPPRPPAPHG